MKEYTMNENLLRMKLRARGITHVPQYIASQRINMLESALSEQASLLIAVAAQRDKTLLRLAEYETNY